MTISRYFFKEPLGAELTEILKAKRLSSYMEPAAGRAAFTPQKLHP